jgi:hypothetical protein
MAYVARSLWEGLAPKRKGKGKKFSHEMMMLIKARQGFKFDFPWFEWFLESLQNNGTCQLMLARIKEERKSENKRSKWHHTYAHAIMHIHMNSYTLTN